MIENDTGGFCIDENDARELLLYIRELENWEIIAEKKDRIAREIAI